MQLKSLPVGYDIYAAINKMFKLLVSNELRKKKS